MIITHNVGINGKTKIEEMTAKVDALADKARIVVVGDPVRVKEYEVAQQEAESFKSAGFTGNAPPSVRSWAEAKGWTAQQAAEDILSAAAKWYTALYAIRDMRLKTKEAIKSANSWAQVQTLFTEFEQNMIQAIQGVR